MTWSHQNRSQLIRIPAATGVYSRMELRSPDPSCNPYLAFAMLIEAGLAGIRSHLKLTPASDFNIYEANDEQLKDITKLPASLGEAIRTAQNSEFIHELRPEKIIRQYCNVKLVEQEELSEALDEETFEEQNYFLNV